MRVVSTVRRATVLAAGALLAAGAASAQTSLLGVPVAPAGVAAAQSPSAVGAPAPAAVGGRSGALRAALADAMDALELGGAEPARYSWEPLLGTKQPAVLGEAAAAGPLVAPALAGIWRLRSDAAYASASVSALSVITRVPFTALRGGQLNGYRVGGYPARSGRYAPPSGFIEVTTENQDFAVSEHFRLRQFLTKDQRSVWPKYLVLDLRLIDKLELVLQELNAMGVRADRMHVMSGYRTPQYNGPGGDGRAALSRHTYGDAADVWVDNDENGYMDDLNGDGRADLDDARVMLRAVDRVERRHPELVGGAGVYVATSAHGPFIHIDTRGGHARW